MKQAIQSIVALCIIPTVYLACIEDAASQQDYTQWKLPDGAIARLGKGGIQEVAFSPDVKLLAVATSDASYRKFIRWASEAVVSLRWPGD